MWIGGSFAILVVLICVGLLIGSRDLERKVQHLRADAERMGMHLNLEPEVINNETKRLLTRVSNAVMALDLELRIDTEDPDELRIVADKAKHIVVDAYALSETSKHHPRDATDWIESLRAFDVLAMDANVGIMRRDQKQVLRALKALRKLAHLLPRDDPIIAGLIIVQASRYYSVIQRAAEHIGEASFMDALIEEVALWKIDDFEYTAKYLPANAIDGIQLEADAEYEGTLIERIRQASKSTHLAQTKQELFALQEAIAIFPQWQKDRHLLEITEDRPLRLSDVRMIAHLLKRSELELQMFQLAAKAVLFARKELSRGRPWPTISDLEAVGMNLTDPVHGEKYEWKEFNDHRRLYGNRNVDLKKAKQNFLLLTFYEQTGPGASQ